MDQAPQTDCRVTLLHARSGQIIARRVELAISRASRRLGLLHRTTFDADAALVLAPCFAVHTAFMHFAIDVVFVDRKGCVRRIVRDLQPWRVAASLAAYATIELPAGAATARGIEVGDLLCLGMATSMSFREPTSPAVCPTLAAPALSSFGSVARS